MFYLRSHVLAVSLLRRDFDEVKTQRRSFGLKNFFPKKELK